MFLTKENVKKTKGPFSVKAVVVLVDEMTEVMTNSNFRLTQQIQDSIGSIARLGRAGACHIVLATQRPSSNVINADLKGNLQQGVLLGDFDASASTLIFDEDISHMSKPEIKGRGYIKSGKEITEFQSYWTEREKDFVLKDMSKVPKLPEEAHDVHQAETKENNGEVDEQKTRSRSKINENEDEERERREIMESMRKQREEHMRKRMEDDMSHGTTSDLPQEQRLPVDDVEKTVPQREEVPLGAGSGQQTPGTPIRTKLNLHKHAVQQPEMAVPPGEVRLGKPRPQETTKEPQECPPGEVRLGKPKLGVPGSENMQGGAR